MENTETNSLIVITLLIVGELILLRATYRGWRFTRKEQDKTIIAWEQAPKWWPLHELTLQYYRSKFHFWIIRLVPLIFLLIVSTLILMVVVQAILKMIK